MKRFVIFAVILLAVALVASGLSAQEEVKKKLVLKLTPIGKQLVKEGLLVTSEDFADMDGDGRDELVISVKDPKKGGRVLAVLHQNAKGTDYEKVYEYRIKRNLEMDRLEIDDIHGDGRPEAILWLKDETPDEVGRHLSIHGFEGDFHTMFEYSYYTARTGGKSVKASDGPSDLPSEPVDKPAAQPAPKGAVKPEIAAPRYKTVSFGQIAEELKFVDENRDGKKVIIIPAGKKTIDVESKKGGKVSYVIGGHYEIYRYKNGRYAKDPQDKMVNFLATPLKHKNVEASSEAADKKTKQVTNPAAYAVDNHIGSAWVPAGKKGGVGENIKVWFDDKVAVRAMILVPGCMEDDDAWENNHRIKAFTLEFSSGETVKIDRTKPLEVEPPVMGIKEIPLGQSKGAVQTIILFDEGFQSRNVQITINDLDKAKKGQKVCLSEVMVF